VLFIEIRVIAPTSRGESYQDLILRLDSVVIELERTRKPVLVIAHNAGAAQHYISPLDDPAAPAPCTFRLTYPRRLA
jgi:broad specificity phosphatase PhoE